jgi:hypothetical protein
LNLQGLNPVIKIVFGLRVSKMPMIDKIKHPMIVALMAIAMLGVPIGINPRAALSHRNAIDEAGAAVTTKSGCDAASLGAYRQCRQEWENMWYISGSHYPSDQSTKDDTRCAHIQQSALVACEQYTAKR